MPPRAWYPTCSIASTPWAGRSKTLHVSSRAPAGRQPGETFSGLPLPWLSSTITSSAPASSSPSAAATVSASMRALPVRQYSGRNENSSNGSVSWEMPSMSTLSATLIALDATADRGGASAAQPLGAFQPLLGADHHPRDHAQLGAAQHHRGHGELQPQAVRAPLDGDRALLVATALEGQVAPAGGVADIDAA